MAQSRKAEPDPVDAILGMPKTDTEWDWCERTVRDFARKLAESDASTIDQKVVPKSLRDAAARIPAAFGLTVSARPRRTSGGRPDTAQRWREVGNSIRALEAQYLDLQRMQQGTEFPVVVNLFIYIGSLLRTFRGHAWDAEQVAENLLQRVGGRSYERSAPEEGKERVPKPVIQAAKREATGTGGYVQKGRLGKKGMTVYHDTEVWTAFRAVATLHGMRPQPYLAQLVVDAIAAHQSPTQRDKLIDARVKRFRAELGAALGKK